MKCSLYFVASPFVVLTLPSVVSSEVTPQKPYLTLNLDLFLLALTWVFSDHTPSLS